MQLNDADLRHELTTEKGLSHFHLEPYEPRMVQPASVDVRLGEHFRVFDDHRYPYIDPAVEQKELTRLVKATQSFMLHPQQVVLGTTLEKVSVGNSLAARLEGKSSLGRLGLLTHATAGFIDPGFTGYITLELVNVSSLPIKLYPGMRIGQLCVYQLTGFSERPYGSQGLGSRYQNQEGPTSSMAYMNL